MVVKCLLCFESPTVPGPKFLEIFGEEGLRLDISSIITKHFWFKTNRNSEDVQQVCLTCWEIVRDFHILYQRVEEVHRHLTVNTIVLDDPLPHDVLLKAEHDQDPIMDDNNMVDPIFDPEVKVEVHDLELLPQIEILESANVPERSLRAGRRGRQSAREQSPKVSAKRIKKEQSPAVDPTSYNYVSDENLRKDDLSTSGSLDDLNKLTTSLEKDDSNKKRRRLRKTEKTKVTTRIKRLKKQPVQAADSEIKNETDAEEQPSCSTAQIGSDAVAEPKIKTEASIEEHISNDFVAAPESFDDDDAYAQDDGDEDNDNDNNYVKDSDESSNSELEAEDSDGSDWNESKKKSEKFAVITKKERNVPKKYKKREKSTAEPKRLSREEIESRQAQQAEYDSIITKFFEKIRCPKCELLVHTFGEMRAHFRSDHNDDHGFIECCGRRFATRKFLAEHIMVHYNPEHFKCKTCDKVCRDSTQLESHEQTHLPNPPPSKYKKTFQCEKCSKTFSSKASFEHHMVAKHVPREEFKFECPECKKKYPSKHRLKEHLHHHNPAEAYMCDQCGKIVYSINTFSKHKTVVHGIKKPNPQIQCELCKKWYKGKGNLSAHMRTMHSSNENNQNVCEICGFVSVNRVAKVKHVRFKHNLIKKYHCSICEKSFKVPTLLKEHMAIHTGVDLYKCSYCPETYKSKSNMFNHCKRAHPIEFENRNRRGRNHKVFLEADDINILT